MLKALSWVPHEHAIANKTKFLHVRQAPARQAVDDDGLVGQIRVRLDKGPGGDVAVVLDEQEKHLLQPFSERDWKSRILLPKPGNQAMSKEMVTQIAPNTSYDQLNHDFYLGRIDTVAGEADQVG